MQAGGRTVEWVSGLYAAVAALAATRVVRLGGPGELVDLSMSEVANTTGTTAADLMDSLRGRPNPTNPGRSFETPSIEPTSDGYVGFNTNTRTQFDSFLLMIERPDLIEDGFWAPISARIMNWEEWNGIIHDWTTKHTTAEVVALAAELRIPVAPVSDGPAVATFEQAVARGSLVDDPTGTYRVPRRPWKIDGEVSPPPRPAPRLGEHTGTVVRAAAEAAGDPSDATPLAGGQGPRPDCVVGGAVGLGDARRARRRRRARGVGHPRRRHAVHQWCQSRPRQLVGVRARCSTPRTPTSATSPSTWRGPRAATSRCA